MKYQLDPKFTIKDRAWCAVRFDEFNHDDRLPVAEVEVTKVNFSGGFYGEENKDNSQKFSYEAIETDGWMPIYLREDELFRTKCEAEAAAIEKLKKSLTSNEKNIRKIEKMMAAQRVAPK